MIGTGLAAPTPSAAPAPPTGGVVALNGLVPVVSARQLLDEEKARTTASQNVPLITGLAAHVRQCFTAAEQAKRESGVVERLKQCVRQRRGEYDPDILTEIKRTGGSDIYMMLSANKARGAAAWIKDVMGGTRDQRPWDVQSTAEPELRPDDKQFVVNAAAQEALMLEAQMGLDMMDPENMRQLIQRIADRKIVLMKENAERKLERMRTKMEDQLQEGGFEQAMSQFIDDLVTFPFAMLKGPVLRNKKQLTWVQGPEGDFVPECKDIIGLYWERVDPFKIYWAPHATEVDEGYLIEHHQLTRGDLEELLGVEGYDEGAIRGVLDDHGTGGLRDWLLQWGSTEQADVEGRSSLSMETNPEAVIDALQMWGNVQGKMLVDWGMDEKQVPDLLKSYNCEVWVIGQYVIKAALNANPLGFKPYFKTCYEKIPGSFTGNGVNDLTRDAQRMCNGAARALANNMGLASGPMVWINTQQLATGEDVTQLYPWRLFQGISDPYANSSQRPIEFYQPNSNAMELMAVYEKYSQLADEYSGVPRYMTGDSPAGGAGRTASGMSMLMNNAGKSVKHVIGNVDLDITGPAIERLHYHNMKYSEDPELKGDVRVVARGVNVLIAKEAAQLRMNEILQIMANSELLMTAVGPEAAVDLFREITKPLNIDVVPDKEVVRLRLHQQQLAALQARQQEQAIEGEAKRVDGKKTVGPNRQQLQNGAPVTDNFQPSRR